MKPKIKKTQIKHFTKSKEERFRKSVEEGSSLRDKLMFDLLFDTGLRLNELNLSPVSNRREGEEGENYPDMVCKWA